MEYTQISKGANSFLGSNRFQASQVVLEFKDKELELISCAQVLSLANVMPKWNAVASRVALKVKKWNAESNMFSDAIFESGRGIR